MAGGLVHQRADPDPSYQPGAGSISALALAIRPAPGGAPRLVAQSGGEFTGSGECRSHGLVASLGGNFSRAGREQALRSGAIGGSSEGARCHVA